MTIIEIDGVQAKLKSDGTWQSKDDLLQDKLNVNVVESDLEDYTPDIDLALANRAIELFGGTIVQHDELKTNSLIVY